MFEMTKPAAQRRSKQLFVRVTPKMKEEVDAKAGDEGCFTSEVLLYLIRQWLTGEIAVPKHAIK